MNSPTATTDVVSFIRSSCKHLLGSKFWQIRFVCKVDAGWKSEKLESKYLVLSKFRCFFLSGKTTAKLQVESSFNVLSLGEINAAHEHELLLGVDGRKLHLRLIESGHSAMDVARQLLQAFKNYFPSCDPLRFMHLEPSSLYALFAVLPRSRPSLSCDGFRRTYAALCDFYKLPFRDEVVWDIEKIYTLHSLSVLRLDDFSHLYPKDLIPVIASLQFMSWFNGISSETFKLAGDVVDAIIGVVRKSQHLKSLILRSCGLKSDFLVSLASALNNNQTVPLDFIDLSGNAFDDGKAVSQFASAISNLTTGFRCLIMGDCGLHSKAVNSLCTALRQNQKRAAAKTLTTISFAKNALKNDATELHNLLSSTELETLDISGTGIALEGILFAMKANSERTSTLLLSGCTFPERKGKDLASSNSVKDFFANASSLTSVDLSECALPSETLKFMLLGIVCNQKISSLHLDLTRSFTDRLSISVMETCAPNLVSVTDLVLRDVGLEQDAVSVIRALSLMPNLRRLDIGGNNFNVTRKQQPKLLVNIMLEMAKLINDEEGSIRELVLSDCHLGVNLSVLLNALGVAPTLISLDISGNDFGNVGARLLAKALQLNTVLETLSIDKNQITIEGYADILHSLKGNYTLRCIPYPLHDACESFKWNREKTELALVELERLLQRNAKKSSWSDLALSTDAHSRLLLTNVEDEINKAVYSAEHLLAECRWKDSNHPDVTYVRKLLDDTEKAKKLLDEMAVVLSRSDFVDDFVQQHFNQYASKFDEKMKTSCTQLTDILTCKDISVSMDKDFTSALRDACVQKSGSLSSALQPIFAELQEKLQQHFKRATFALAFGAVEKVEQELLRSLSAANKNLAETKNSPTIRSSGSAYSAAPSFSSSSGTPKGKRKKFRWFPRNPRPKSIIEVDGVLDNADDTLEEATLGGTPGDSCGDSLDSESFEVVEKPTTNDEDSNEPSKLTHLVKDRPRLPYQRRGRAVAPRQRQSSKDELDYDAGVDSFFSTEANKAEGSNASPTKEPLREDQAPSIAVTDAARRISRIPPNAVPLIGTELLQERTALAKVSLSPRAPPNTPSSAKLRDDGNQSASVSVSSITEIDTAEESSSKQPSTLSEVSVLSHSSDKKPVLPAVSAATVAKIVAPSPISSGIMLDTASAPEPVRLTHADEQPIQSKTAVTDGPVTRPLALSPLVPEHLPSRDATPRRPDNNGNTASQLMEEMKSAAAPEQNNNSASADVASPGARAAMTPPPRPPPPPSAKLRDMKLRQVETTSTVEVEEGPVLRNKSVDAAGSQTQATQRKSVMDLTAMFETKPPPPGRPVPPPRPNKSKIAPAAD